MLPEIVLLKRRGRHIIMYVSESKNSVDVGQAEHSFIDQEDFPFILSLVVMAS